MCRGYVGAIVVACSKALGIGVGVHQSATLIRHGDVVGGNSAAGELADDLIASRSVRGHEDRYAAESESDGLAVGNTAYGSGNCQTGTPCTGTVGSECDRVVASVGQGYKPSSGRRAGNATNPALRATLFKEGFHSRVEIRIGLVLTEDRLKVHKAATKNGLVCRTSVGESTKESL